MIKHRFLPGALAALGLCASPVLAQQADGPLPFDAVPADAASPFGGMSISPTRVQMQAGRGGEQVTLFNSSSQTVTYRIELVDFAIDETGTYRDLEEGEPAPWSAAPFIRFAPRQVTLGPNQRQSVKFLSSVPRDMAPGELRSHIRFSSIPTVAPADTPAKGSDGSRATSVSISVGLDYRITVPVLLTIGDPQPGTMISEASVSGLDGSTPQAAVTLLRTGDRSTFGTVRVLAADGTELGVLRNVGVLPPARTRKLGITLNKGGAAPARVVFDEQIDSFRTGRRLSEAQLK